VYCVVVGGVQQHDTMPISKDRVSYYYDAEVGSVYFGPNHPMKPHRLCMTHHLVLAYKLQEKMEVYRPRRAYPVEMATFHSEDYIDFLNRVTPDNQHEFLEQLTRFNLAEDCPIFDGLFDFCRIYTGGSIDGAVRPPAPEKTLDGVSSRSALETARCRTTRKRLARVGSNPVDDEAA
jgi:hypothetical protein